MGPELITASSRRRASRGILAGRANGVETLPHPDVVSRSSGTPVEHRHPSGPEVARALVENGVDVLEISPVERSLEEVFFEMAIVPSL
ncbi:hypothetical protein GCM10022223_24190 [Kineosporia mesophila]|uniref:DUF4162 domain-containing protein n=1 Tax=Kineosporia mesophila TaxID=566012 RepID=A0ABP6ZFF7_9ACTN|nr:hypothetical protein [Kineosporia mesophila]MCD5354252.1 hypothetical protein [Kineosporia mesophila]